MRMSPKRKVGHSFIDNASRQGCWWFATKTRDHSLLHCNAPKSAVDNMDHLACIYSCKRKINRWPMVLFFNMLDTAAIVSFVIWMCSNPDWNKLSKAIRRRQVIVSLGECLAEPLIRRRLDNAAQLRRPIMDAIKLLQLTLKKPKQELRGQLKRRHRDFKLSPMPGWVWQEDV